MRMICLVNYETKSVSVYSLCTRFKHRLFVEEEVTSVKRDDYSIIHYDIHMSWRRFKKGIQKQGFTFPNLVNGIHSEY